MNFLRSTVILIWTQLSQDTKVRPPKFLRGQKAKNASNLGKSLRKRLLRKLKSTMLRG